MNITTDRVIRQIESLPAGDLLVYDDTTDDWYDAPGDLLDDVVHARRVDQSSRWWAEVYWGEIRKAWVLRYVTGNDAIVGLRP